MVAAFWGLRRRRRNKLRLYDQRQDILQGRSRGPFLRLRNDSHGRDRRYGSCWLTGSFNDPVRIESMRRAAFIIAVGLLVAALDLPVLAGADDRPVQPPISCSNGIVGSLSCIASKQDRKEAHNAFARGMKLQERRQFEEAFTQFDQASRLVPQDRQFLTARELLKAQLVYGHVERGNALLMDNSRPQAASEFRAAIELDPENEFARERLEEATREPAPPTAKIVPAQLTDAGEIQIEPATDRATEDRHGRG